MSAAPVVVMNTVNCCVTGIDNTAVVAVAALRLLLFASFSIVRLS